MEALAPTSEPRTTTRCVDEPLSPELALVDQELAERARLALPNVQPTEALIALRLQRAKAEVASVRPPRGGPEAPARAAPDKKRRVRVSVASVAIVLGAAAAATLIAPRLVGGRSPTSSAATPRLEPTPGSSLAKPRSVGATTPTRTTATTSTRTSRPSATAKGSQTQTSRRDTARPTRRKAVSSPLPSPAKRSALPPIPDFVWAPAKAPGGYRLEFRSGSKVVFRTRTRATRLHVSRSILGQKRYRWLVWRLNAQGRAVGSALVDATVRIR
jgi:hypothetical protein